MQIDSPMSAEELERPGMLSIFTAVRHLGGIFPMGFVKEADDRNSEAGSTVLALESRHDTGICYVQQSIFLSMFLHIRIPNLLTCINWNWWSILCSERALLNRLAVELHKLDCDVLVGHNISGFDLDIFLHRAQVCLVLLAFYSWVILRFTF